MFKTLNSPVLVGVGGGVNSNEGGGGGGGFSLRAFYHNRLLMHSNWDQDSALTLRQACSRVLKCEKSLNVEVMFPGIICLSLAFRKV